MALSRIDDSAEVVLEESMPHHVHEQANIVDGLGVEGKSSAVTIISG